MAKITKVSYQRAFVIGPYLQEKIGAEIELGEGEDKDAAFAGLKQTVNGWAEAVTNNSQPEAAITGVEDQIEAFIDAINTCTVLEKPDGLLSFERASMQHPRLREAYKKKLKELAPGLE